MSQQEPKKDTDVYRILERIQKLPSLPNLVVEILESFDNENVDIATLANKIACDQAIAARVLRVANSPFFGLSGQIGSISEAVTVLGFNNLRGLVAGAVIIDLFPRSGNVFDWKKFWRHSIAVAVCAKVLGKHMKADAETAFTAGLLHDIGKLVMGVHFPEVFPESLQFDDDCSLETLHAEQAILGLDHAALGGEIALRWRFPPHVQQAIAQHHMAAEQTTENSLIDIIYVANLFAHALEADSIREDKMLPLARAFSTRLGLERGVIAPLAKEAHQFYTGAISLIGS